MATGVDHLELLGGRLCLDFVNTVDWRTGDAPRECLTGYAELLSWGRRAGIVSAAETARLRRLAAARPAAASAALARALELREALYRTLRAAAGGNAPAAADLAVLNRALAAASPAVALVRTRGGYGWRAADAGAMDGLLPPLAWSGAELLASDDLARVGQCDGPGCGWLFLDLTRNKSRRWCAMASCGNRAKARRHYARKRGR